MKYENFKNEVYLVRKCQRCVNVKEKYFSKEFDNSYVVDYRKLDDDLEIMKSIVDFINC